MKSIIYIGFYIVGMFWLLYVFCVFKRGEIGAETKDHPLENLGDIKTVKAEESQ